MNSTASLRLRRIALLAGITVAPFLAGIGGVAIAGSIQNSAATNINGKQASIEIVDFMQFTPVDMTIEPGTTVTWTNFDGSNHNIAVDSQQSGRLHMNSTWSHTFNSEGTFAYACVMHPRMKGTITVQ